MHIGIESVGACGWVQFHRAERTLIACRETACDRTRCHCTAQVFSIEALTCCTRSASGAKVNSLWSVVNWPVPACKLRVPGGTKREQHQTSAWLPQPDLGATAWATSARGNFARLCTTLTLPVSVAYNQPSFMVRRFGVHATRTKLASGKPVPNMEL